MSKAQIPDFVNNLLKDPSKISEAFNDPAKFGMDFYDSLTTRQKQYIIFAAAAGLVAYGISLGSSSKK